LKTASRWLESSMSQRRFAAYYNMDQLPYRFEEIPVGSVILTNPNAFITGAVVLKDLKEDILSSFSRSAHKAFLKLKSAVCLAGTGKVNTHAELSLGDGVTFDLDKDIAHSDPIHGQMKLNNKMGKTCYSDVMIPNEDAMLASHLDRFPDS